MRSALEVKVQQIKLGRNSGPVNNFRTQDFIYGDGLRNSVSKAISHNLIFFNMVAGLLLPRDVIWDIE